MSETLHTSLTYEYHGDGPLLIRPTMRNNVGEVIEGHVHTFDHWTFFWTAWKLKATGPEGQQLERTFPAGSIALIRKAWTHELTSLPHEVPSHQQALLDTIAAVLAGEQEVSALAPAVELWRKHHEWQIHSFYCLYAHHTPQGDVVERYTGWPDAYR